MTNLKKKYVEIEVPGEVEDIKISKDIEVSSQDNEYGI